MAEIKLPDIRPAKTIEEKLDALYDAYYMMRKWLNYAFSGVLDAENVMEAATVKRLTAEQINVLDGIILGANATINWGELPSLPTPAQIGARPDTWMPSADDVGAISSTYIDKNGVFTPQVYATNINVSRGKITTAQIVDLVVGGNVTMGPNATISWSKITDRPTIPSQYTDAQALEAWKNSGYATWIDANGVYSGAFNGGMFNINPMSDPALESGLTIGGWYNGAWKGEALKVQYEEYGNLGFPGTIVSSLGGVPLVFELATNFDYYVQFRSGSVVSFRGDVDFTGANVTGLSAVAVFG